MTSNLSSYGSKIPSEKTPMHLKSEKNAKKEHKTHPADEKTDSLSHSIKATKGQVKSKNLDEKKLKFKKDKEYLVDSVGPEHAKLNFKKELGKELGKESEESSEVDDLPPSLEATPESSPDEYGDLSDSTESIATEDEEVDLHDFLDELEENSDLLEDPSYEDDTEGYSEPSSPSVVNRSAHSSKSSTISSSSNRSDNSSISSNRSSNRSDQSSNSSKVSDVNTTITDENLTPLEVVSGHSLEDERTQLIEIADQIKVHEKYLAGLSKKYNEAKKSNSLFEFQQNSMHSNHVLEKRLKKMETDLRSMNSQFYVKRDALIAEVLHLSAHLQKIFSPISVSKEELKQIPLMISNDKNENVANEIGLKKLASYARKLESEVSRVQSDVENIYNKCLSKLKTAKPDNDISKLKVNSTLKKSLQKQIQNYQKMYSVIVKIKSTFTESSKYSSKSVLPPIVAKYLAIRDSLVNTLLMIENVNVYGMQLQQKIIEAEFEYQSKYEELTKNLKTQADYSDAVIEKISHDKALVKSLKNLTKLKNKQSNDEVSRRGIMGLKLNSKPAKSEDLREYIETSNSSENVLAEAQNLKAVTTAAILTKTKVKKNKVLNQVAFGEATSAAAKAQIKEKLIKVKAHLDPNL